jgi:hypothetical protein
MARRSRREDRGFDTLRFNCPACGELCVFTYRGLGEDHVAPSAPWTDLMALGDRQSVCESCDATHVVHEGDDGNWGVLTTQFHPFPQPAEETEAGV